jgi:hypothetical protein
MSSNVWRWLKWVRYRRRAAGRPPAREEVARRRWWRRRPLGVEEVQDRTLLSAMPSLQPGGVFDVRSEACCASHVPSPTWRLTATAARGR